MCKCVHFRVKFGAVFEASLKADRAILSYIFFQYLYAVRSDDVILLKSRWNLVDRKTTTAGNNVDNFYPF